MGATDQLPSFECLIFCLWTGQTHFSIVLIYWENASSKSAIEALEHYAWGLLYCFYCSLWKVIYIWKDSTELLAIGITKLVVNTFLSKCCTQQWKLLSKLDLCKGNNEVIIRVSGISSIWNRSHLLYFKWGVVSEFHF